MGMTLRERFNRIMRFQDVDRLPYVSFEKLSWVQTHRWKDEGMGPACNPFAYFGFDEACNDRATNWLDQGRGLESVEIDPYAMPRFEPRPVRHEGEFFYTFDVRTGVLMKRMAARDSGDLSVKAHAELPVRDHRDWQEYRKRFDPHTPERYPRLKEDHLTIHPREYPDTWDACVQDIAAATHIVRIVLASGYNYVSNAIGFERLLEALLTEPDWVEEMVSHFGWFSRESRRKAIETARFDYVSFEDNTPPRTVHGELLVSPDLFLRYVGEAYRKGLALVAESGIDLVEMPHTRHREFETRVLRMVVDARLTPILTADGDGDFTVEARRREYGRQFPIWGGMDMRALLQGAKAIDEMIDRTFALAAEGGFFPTLCDRYGELIEVSLRNFEYYTEAFRRANGME